MNWKIEDDDDFWVLKGGRILKNFQNTYAPLGGIVLVVKRHKQNNGTWYLGHSEGGILV
ncbi:MAG: hypothetical protein Q8778_02590 [Sweet potato little leaf phytoplasma]|nr:hypothetical protein [Sweet potato little leaf phytoplasma]